MISPKLLFPSVFGGVVVLSLLSFTFTIGNGRLSGSGICLALSAGVLVYVARFLFESAKALVATGADAQATEEKAASGRRRRELEREYHNLKRALKELELDHAMAKVSEEDYQESRSRYRERAVRVLRQLDQGESYRAQIEADLKARRTALGLADPPRPVAAKTAEPEDAASASPAAPEAAALEAPATEAPSVSIPGLCRKCETRNDSDAVFCKKCGQKL
jgi:hypothetical protein